MTDKTILRTNLNNRLLLYLVKTDRKDFYYKIVTKGYKLIATIPMSNLDSVQNYYREILGKELSTTISSLIEYEMK